MTKRQLRKNLADPRVAIGYVRVSTDREKQELGAEAQRRAIHAWAKREAVRVAAVFEEEVSGGADLDRRPVLLEAVAEISVHRAGRFVVARLDRFARNTTTAMVVGLELAKAGAELVTASGEGNGDDPASKMMRGILLEVAQYERAIIAARIKAAMSVKRSRGDSMGAPGRHAYGFKVDAGKLVPNPKEQAIIAEARRLRAAGLPIREVIEALAEQRMFNRAGRAFDLPAMFKILSANEREKARE